ncbi:GNAT family N-acetyltransferase [Photobacterium sp. WH77]|uniref:GNAT family N-acetyltransferase n=1 Tax=unclassified Photobacterium TaxID=2628852 RepID=UPI001EDB4891|nr:GNAT family N-acetyltransferase [Photobacterium sp. WH77]MCG2846330.1 GNAT family N-acetyltransferase [Photobacterium sp. WH80]
MEINLRNAVQADVQQIAKIHVSSWKAAFDGLMPDNYINGYTLSSRVEEWQKTICTNAEKVVVAECGEVVVGFMSYRIHPENSETIELSKLYLCPSVYGQRLGSRFMNHLEEESQAQGMKAIHLYVLDTNETAIQFYSKHGFQFSDGCMSEEFEGTTIIDLLMTKRV